MAKKFTQKETEALIAGIREAYETKLRQLTYRLEGLEGGERAALEREIHLLEGMLREVREVGQLVRHYYEPAYCRDSRYTL